MKIVVLDGYALNPGDLSWDALNKLGEVTVYDRTPKDKILERAQEAEIILTNKTVLSREILMKLNKAKYIGVLATGYNVVDVDAASELKITVTNVPAYSTDSVAQLVFAFILEFCGHVQEHSNSAREEWAKSLDFCYWQFPLIELTGKSIGIIGFGNIGKKVAAIATAFGMNVLIYSRSRAAELSLPNAKFVEMEQLFKESDFISVHCPLTEQTKGLVNKDTISLMKKSAFLINTSRGPVIVDEELAEALNKEKIAGAALDVLTTEPPAAENPLLKAKNCFITPHVAWASTEARVRLMDIAVENVEAFLKRNAKNVVNGK